GAGPAGPGRTPGDGPRVGNSKAAARARAAIGLRPSARGAALAGMTMSARLRTAFLLLLCGLCCGPPAASQAGAQSVESFYKGRTVTMLVGTSPGGINDISSRLVARHLSRFIAGNPTIIVQNNPGGGRLVPRNRLYFNSDKDGSVLAKLERAVPQLAIQG